MRQRGALYQQRALGLAHPLPDGLMPASGDSQSVLNPGASGRQMPLHGIEEPNHHISSDFVSAYQPQLWEPIKGGFQSSDEPRRDSITSEKRPSLEDNAQIMPQYIALSTKIKNEDANVIYQILSLGGTFL